MEYTCLRLLGKFGFEKWGLLAKGADFSRCLCGHLNYGQKAVITLKRACLSANRPLPGTIKPVQTGLEDHSRYEQEQRGNRFHQARQFKSFDNQDRPRQR